MKATHSIAAVDAYHVQALDNVHYGCSKWAMMAFALPRQLQKHVEID